MSMGGGPIDESGENRDRHTLIDHNRDEVEIDRQYREHHKAHARMENGERREKMGNKEWIYCKGGMRQ